METRILCSRTRDLPFRRCRRLLSACPGKVSRNREEKAHFKTEGKKAGDEDHGFTEESFCDCLRRRYRRRHRYHYPK